MATVATGSGSPVAVAGLPAGTYVFTVSAVSGAGAGPSSAGSAPVTVTGATERTWNAGFCGGDNSQAGHVAYSTLHGFAIGVAGTWDDSYASWDQAAAGYTDWLVPERLNPPNASLLTVIAPGLLLAGGGNQNMAALQAASSGADLAHWQHIGRRALAGGWNSPSTIFRIGHEMNGTWYPWGTGGKNPTYGGYFAGAFRYAVQGIRKYCPLVRFDLCFNSGYQGDSSTLDSHYPGDAYVDIVSMDLYDGFSTGHVATTPAEFSASQGPLSFASVGAFAHAHGKLFALDEWGMNGTQAGHDNSLFVEQVFDSLVDLDTTYPGIVSHDCFFDLTSGGAGNWAANPAASAAYRGLWTT